MYIGHWRARNQRRVVHQPFSVGYALDLGMQYVLSLVLYAVGWQNLASTVHSFLSIIDYLCIPRISQSQFHFSNTPQTKTYVAFFLPPTYSVMWVSTSSIYIAPSHTFPDILNYFASIFSLENQSNTRKHSIISKPSKIKKWHNPKICWTLTHVEVCISQFIFPSPDTTQPTWWAWFFHVDFPVSQGKHILLDIPENHNISRNIYISFHLPHLSAFYLERSPYATHANHLKGLYFLIQFVTSRDILSRAVLLLTLSSPRRQFFAGEGVEP